MTVTFRDSGSEMINLNFATDVHLNAGGIVFRRFARFINLVKIRHGDGNDPVDI